MTACSKFGALRKEVDAKGKGATLKARLHSLKGSALVKEYMACMRSGRGRKSARKTSMKVKSMKKKTAAKKTRKARK
jgi:hypothetical protein